MWTVTGPPTGVGAVPVFTALFKVVAHDAANNSGSDQSDAPFAILDLATGTLLSMFQAQSIDASVEVRWEFGGSVEISETSVQRAETENGPWTPVSVERRQEGNVTVAVDRTVVGGQTYYYRLASRVAGGGELYSNAIQVKAGEAIKVSGLSYVGPNPTAGRTTIEYTLARTAKVRVGVVDIQGRTVATLVDGSFSPGRYQAVWNGSTERGRAPAGVYFVQFQGAGVSAVKRLVVAQ